MLFGNGDGSFQSPITYPVGAYEPLSLALGDFDGDGKTDIAVVSQSVSGSNTAGVVSVLLGNGNGTFQPPVAFNPGGSGSIALAVADVNKDGKPDIMVVDATGIGVLINASTKATTTKLVSSKNPATFTQTVTFTATVTPQGTGTPTGTVSFFDGASNIGSSPLNGSGVATFATSTLALGYSQHYSELQRRCQLGGQHVCCVERVRARSRCWAVFNELELREPDRWRGQRRSKCNRHE